MKRIMSYFNEHHDKDLSCYQKDFLAQILASRMAAASLETIADYCAELVSNPYEADQFLESLQISYSEFFREPLAFWIMEKQILPEVLKRKKGGSEIRIWSAGCAMGQEAYSIAMLAAKVLDRSGSKVKLRIFASDLSEALLDRARQGRYSRREVKGLNLEYLDQAFREDGSLYEISPAIKKRVSFSVYDLLEEDTICPADSIYGGFDIIFCRNVLIYYDRESQKAILEKLQKALGEKGYLITGDAESALVERWMKQPSYQASGAVFQSKGGWKTGGAR